MFAPRRLCAAVDLSGFSTRSPTVQALLQEKLRCVLEQAWRASAVEPVRVGQGDGEVSMAPLEVDESAFVSGFLRALRIAVRPANRGLLPGAPERMRLRVAMHYGAAAVGVGGLVGCGVVRTCRLLDNTELRRVLVDHPTADVALIVSDSLFEDVIWAEQDELTRDDFHRVRVVLEGKGFAADAWVHVAATGPAATAALSPADAEQLLAMALVMAGQMAGRRGNGLRQVQPPEERVTA